MLYEVYYSRDRSIPRVGGAAAMLAARKTCENAKFTSYVIFPASGEDTVFTWIGCDGRTACDVEAAMFPSRIRCSLYHTFLASSLPGLKKYVGGAELECAAMLGCPICTLLSYSYTEHCTFAAGPREYGHFISK